MRLRMACEWIASGFRIDCEPLAHARRCWRDEALKLQRGAGISLARVGCARLSGRSITFREMTDMPYVEVGKRLDTVDTRSLEACSLRPESATLSVGGRMGRAPLTRHRAACLRTVIVSLLVATLAGCATMDRRAPTQPAAIQQGCDVPGQFCNTFFGP